MPGFDPEIGKLAQRVLINPRKIDYHTGVFAKKVTCGLYYCAYFGILEVSLKIPSTNSTFLLVLVFVVDNSS